MTVFGYIFVLYFIIYCVTIENYSFFTKMISQTKYGIYILREKSLAIYFEDSQFIRIRTFNFIVSKIYVDKRSRVR